MTTKVITSKDIQVICDTIGLDKIMQILIQRMLEAFNSFDKMKTTIPVRSGFNYKIPVNGLIEWMPLHDLGEQIVIKLVGYHPENPVSFDLPTILSNISIYNINNGHLECLMDGGLPTALRTGAASAVATEILSDENSEVLGLIGCGAQAITQFHALHQIRTIKKVLFYDIDEPTMKLFPEHCDSFEHDCILVESTIEDILNGSDIICTATSIAQHEGPLFKDFKVKDHVHINAVGSDFPGKTEIPYNLLSSCYVVPDFKEQAEIEGESQQLSEAQIGYELEHVVKNRNQFKGYQQRKTVFDSTGYPLEDKVVAEMFLEFANSMNIGLEIELECNFDNSKNPYSFVKSYVPLPSK